MLEPMVRVVNAFVPGLIANARNAAAAAEATVPRRRSRFVRRVAAIARLLARRRGEGAVVELQHLDHAALRELGLTERRWVALTHGTSVAAARRLAELDYLLSASARFAVRGVDTHL
jgi:hypothetical protein